MTAGVAELGGNGDLRVVPGVDGDAGRLPADRVAAIRRHHQRRLETTAVVERHDGCRRRPIDAGNLRANACYVRQIANDRSQGIGQRHLRHVGAEVGKSDLGRGERDLGRAQQAVAVVDDADAFERGDRTGEHRHGAEVAQQRHRPREQGGGAGVGRRSRRRRRADEGDAGAAAGECGCRRASGRAGAGNDDIECCHGVVLG